MSFIPDPHWLNAFKLPTKVVGGLFIASVTLLFLDHYSVLQLSELGSKTVAIVWVGGVITGCLLLASLVELLTQPFRAKAQTSALAKRRSQRMLEKKLERDEARQNAVDKLDHLSGRELRVVADALREGSPSFYTYANSSAVSQLRAKNLVYTPGGAHHTDHYPFTFHDFVWEVLVERKAEFLQRSEDAQSGEPVTARGRRRR